MKISIIIPAYRESGQIGELIRHIWTCPMPCEMELLVVDAQSEDDTAEEAAAAGAQVLQSPAKGRAAQMNYGAEHAAGNVLYFLHADAFPPRLFLYAIKSAVEAGYDFGHFRQRILSKNKWVRFNSFMSRWNSLAASGGDQSLFMKAEFFEKLGGFNASLALMEDYDLVLRARKKGRWIKIPAYLEVVDRKYTHNSFLRVNLVNVVIFLAYRLGVSSDVLKRRYTQWIKGPRYKSLEEPA